MARPAPQFDQSFATSDDSSQTKPSEELCDVGGEVQTLMQFGKSEGPEATGEAPANGAASATSPISEVRKAEPGDDAKTWTKDMLKGLEPGISRRGD